jgi:hypothetical protein
VAFVAEDLEASLTISKKITVIGKVDEISVSAMCELIKGLRQVGHSLNIEQVTLPTLRQWNLLTITHSYPQWRYLNKNQSYLAHDKRHQKPKSQFHSQTQCAINSQHQNGLPANRAGHLKRRFDGHMGRQKVRRPWHERRNLLFIQ